ncbi:MAG TPA: metal ABC transporter substrate-binding protein [Dehalococcoidales bacterium]|nr:metal ABC transporter substrate-binding protein [Dehalococcoidales bacterium]
MMKNMRILVFAVVVAGTILTPILSGCTPTTQGTDTLKVVTSTSHLKYIAERVGGDLVDVTSIVPASQHPGDFDATPGDIKKLTEADIFLVHGFPGETFVPGLVESADNPDLKLVTVKVDGNWMTPSVQVEAAEIVARTFAREDMDNENSYLKRADEYSTLVVEKNTEIQQRLKGTGIVGTPTLCSFWQAGFARWLGLYVIETYGPAELTPQDTQSLIDKGRESGVTLVIDNVHSGKDAGKAIAEELGVARVIILYFPGAFDDTETWEKAIDRNVELILDALGH